MGQSRNGDLTKRGNMERAYLTEVLPIGDKRGNDPRFDVAKKKKISGLEVVLKEDAPSDAIVLGGIFLLSIKNEGTQQDVYKARYILQGQKDKDK